MPGTLLSIRRDGIVPHRAKRYGSVGVNHVHGVRHRAIQVMCGAGQVIAGYRAALPVLVDGPLRGGHLLRRIAVGTDVLARMCFTHIEHEEHHFGEAKRQRVHRLDATDIHRAGHAAGLQDDRPAAEVRELHVGAVRAGSQ